MGKKGQVHLLAFLDLHLLSLALTYYKQTFCNNFAITVHLRELGNPLYLDIIKAFGCSYSIIPVDADMPAYAKTCESIVEEKVEWILVHLINEFMPIDLLTLLDLCNGKYISTTSKTGVAALCINNSSESVCDCVITVQPYEEAIKRGLFKRLTSKFTHSWNGHTIKVLRDISRKQIIVPKDSSLSTLEIGCFEGKSTMAIASTFPHARNWICVDPWEDGPYSELEPIDFTNQFKTFIENTCLLGQKLVMQRSRSLHAIANLATSGVKLVFVLIDGDHSAEATYNDAAMTWPLVVSGGLVLFDDYEWRGSKQDLPAHATPKPGIDKWLSENLDAKVLIKNWQVLVQKSN